MSADLRLFDHHAHLDAFDEDGSLPEVLERARAAGVQRILAIGGSVTANQRAVDLALRYPDQLRAAVGFDRDEAAGEPDWPAAELGLAQAVTVAVGETGLDYHYTPETAEAQKHLFRANLERAVRFRKPVIVHTREADEDTVALLSDYARAWAGDPGRLGVIHCFTGSATLARRLLDLGFLISFSGIVTFKNSGDLREVARLIPADRLLVETDAPFLAPVPFRGKRNEPGLVRHVAEALASVRNDTLQAIAELTWVNGTKLFGWENQQHE